MLGLGHHKNSTETCCVVCCFGGGGGVDFQWLELVPAIKVKMVVWISHQSLNKDGVKYQF